MAAGANTDSWQTRLSSARFESDADTVTMLPVSIKCTGSHYWICRMDNGAIVQTGGVGYEAVRLFRKGKSIGAVKSVLGLKYGFPAEKVDLVPLIKSLVDKEMISKIGTRVLPIKQEPAWKRRRMALANAVLAQCNAQAIRYLPLSSILSILYGSRNAQVSELGKTMQRNLSLAAKLNLSESERASLSESNSVLRTHALIDRLLVATLPPSRLRQWFADYTTVEGRSRIDEAAQTGKRIVLCGFHTGSYSLLPYLLAANGYSITALINAQGVAEQQTAEETVKHLRTAGLSYDLKFTYGTVGIRKLVPALEAQRLALILPDAFLGESPRGTPIEFLGSTIRPSSGLAWLCRRLEATIIPVYLRTSAKGFHTLTIDEPIPVCAGANEDEINRKVYCVLERVVSESPQQWLRWNDFHNMSAADIL
jgi:lauroyl/myristoyl acyltransferase